MKIVQVPHLYLPHLGGIENYVYRLKKSLESRGHEVEIITSDLSLEDSSGEKEEDTYYCDTIAAPIRNPICMDLVEKIRETDADIYHLHSPWFFNSLFSTLALEEKPKVMTVHSAEMEGHDLKSSLALKAYRPFASYVLNQMDMMFTQGSDQKEVLTEDFSISKDKVDVIPNGIILEDFSEDKADETGFLEEYGISEDSFKILYVSRMVGEKNQKSLVGAVTDELEDKDIELILIGDGEPEYVSDLEEMADDRVHILGRVDFDDLVSAYHACDLFVFLGTWEGMPTVIMESMLCGSPIISTPVGGIPDIIEEEKHGFFVDLPVSTSELAEKINLFLDMDEEEVEEMGRINSKEIEDNYNWESIAGRMLENYEEVLDKYES